MDHDALKRFPIASDVEISLMYRMLPDDVSGSGIPEPQ